MRPLLALLLSLALLVGCGGDGEDDEPAPPPEQPAEPRPDDEQENGLARAEDGPEIETIATGLDVPWDIAFLPDGRALVTERGGSVRLLTRGFDLREVGEVEVNPAGEGGLLGAAVDPDFEENSFVYLYRTTATGNVVTRYRFEDGELTGARDVVDGMPAADIHNGGRIHFGPDGALYIAAGDAAQPELAQDPDSLAGKLLRWDGDAVDVHSVGHRNQQGFDWHPDTGQLVAAEHGPVGDDEINFIREGENYGWPEVTGDDDGGGRFETPAAVYDDAIAPSGATFVSLPDSAWTGDLLVAALRGEQLRRLRFANGRADIDEPLYRGELGRLRTVVEGPDGALYLLTSNRDGRGSPEQGDDRILRLVPPGG